MYMFFLLYKHTNDGVFDDFPKISEDFSKLFRKPDETFLNIFRTFRTFSKDYRRLLKTTEEDSKMFRSYTSNDRDLSVVKGTKKIVIKNDIFICDIFNINIVSQ